MTGNGLCLDTNFSKPPQGWWNAGRATGCGHSHDSLCGHGQRRCDLGNVNRVAPQGRAHSGLGRGLPAREVRGHAHVLPRVARGRQETVLLGRGAAPPPPGRAQGGFQPPGSPPGSSLAQRPQGPNLGGQGVGPLGPLPREPRASAVPPAAERAWLKAAGRSQSRMCPVDRRPRHTVPRRRFRSR